MAFVTCSSLVISNKTLKFIGQDWLIEGKKKYEIKAGHFFYAQTIQKDYLHFNFENRIKF